MPKAKPTGMSPTAGRPSLLTDEALKDICEALEDGCTYDAAATQGGITYRTFNNWRKRGIAELERREAGGKATDRTGKAEQIYFDFFHDTKKAESDGQRKHLKNIKQAGETQWQASAWIMERRYPADFARRTYARIEGLDALVEQAEKRGISVQELIAAMNEALADDDNS